MLDDMKITSHLAIPLGATISLIVLARYFKTRDSLRKSELPYPPGPKGLPLIGNVLDVPRGVPIWEGFTRMAKIYQADIMYLNMFGIGLMVLSSSETIADLLDKRSVIYSDKPQTLMTELIGLNKWLFTMLEYGERWRAYRRLFHKFFNATSTKRYDEDQKKATSRLLKNLSEHPADFHRHIQLATGSLALSITYGIQADSMENPYFRAAEKTIESFQDFLVPGAFPVDFLPILRHVPSWLPGGGARSYGERFHKLSMDTAALQMRYVTERLMAGGENSRSMALDCLEDLANLREQGMDEEVVRNVTGSVYMAMTETTNTVLNTFFLAMARNTHVVKKAQKQLDGVLGGGELPNHSDIDKLPYIIAIIKETIRWSPPLPIGASHRLMQDDVYNGMFIPAGTTLLENIWGICHDEKVYPDPETFNPDRFLGKDEKIDPSVKDPEIRVFGSGRRICPGRHFALRNLHLVVANVLAAFDILPPVDKNGHAKPPPAAFKHTLVRHPLPFECIVKPRSEVALGLVKDMYAHYWS